MPTDAAGAPAALFLFAHQDDEFGVFHTIEDCLARGQRVVCAYLTRGAPAVALRRNAESRKVLIGLGVQPADISFAGDLLQIDDGSLPRHLARAAEWIDAWFGNFGEVAMICVTAWEGGHQDHDALHLIAAREAQKRRLLPVLWQYSLYHGQGLRGPFFKVLSPLPANGAPQVVRIPFARRLAYLRLCLSYPSQRGTWIGLFPFVLAHYLLCGVQALQPVSIGRLTQRPHPGALYYERRRFYTWEEMQDRIGAAVPPPPAPR